MKHYMMMFITMVTMMHSVIALQQTNIRTRSASLTAADPKPLSLPDQDVALPGKGFGGNDMRPHYLVMRQRAAQLQLNARFIIAVHRNNAPEIKKLLAARADPATVDMTGKAILDVASDGEHQVAYEAIMDHSFSLESEQNQSGLTLFMFAAGRNSVDLMKSAQGRGADINRVDANGLNALWHAVHAYARNAIAYLMTLENLDMSVCDGNNKTVLQYNVSRGRIDVLELLLTHKNITQVDKNTALSIALGRRYEHVVRLLEAAGAVVPTIEREFEAITKRPLSPDHALFEAVKLRYSPSTESSSEFESDPGAFDDFADSSQSSDSVDLTPPDRLPDHKDTPMPINRAHNTPGKALLI